MRSLSKTALILLVLAFTGAGLTGCSSTSNTKKGAGVGAAAGGAIGGVIGHQSGNTVEGALIGAAIGGAAGAVIGREMDKQAEEMEEDLEGVEVERVAEGIKLHFDSGILFEIDRSDLSTQARQNLDKLATIFDKYPDTEVLIEGHTDITGTHDHNMELSDRRADSVRNYLVSRGTDSSRLRAMGYGPDQPVATNDTAAGRQLNRRVEVAVMANEDMKKAAERAAEKGG